MSAVATAAGLPTRLGKYEILTPLASGGMARIYIGRSTGIGSFERHVVLKMILPERANDETSVQMFLDEARLAASLNHQNVAQVFEVGEDAGIHFLAMEYVHGQDLRALLAKAGSVGTRVPLELALTVVAGAAAGLEHAHERRTSDGVPMGIVHRDVSPSNIMIGYDGAVKLLDFGIAKATSRSVETQAGIIKGKFAYMAPEQCRGREVDRRSDVFSLGIILYEVTTQHRCFRAESDFDTMHRIVTGDVVRPSRLVPGYPQALEAIVMKALAVDVSQRYQSSGQLLEAIESFAVASRMSLSTMSLGRFMRELFGDVQEPWLASGRIDPPPPSREHTISSTNATAGSLPAPARMHEEAPLHLPPNLPLFDRALAREPEAARAGSPPPAAALVQAPQPAVYAAAASSSSALLAAVHVAQGGGMLPADQPTLIAPEPGPAIPPSDMALGSQSLPPQVFAPPPFTHSGSASGAALPVAAPGGPASSNGYVVAAGTSRSDISQLRHEPPAPDPSLELQPRRRILYIGLGMALVGVIVLVVVLIADGTTALPPPPPRTTATFVAPAPSASEASTTAPGAAAGTGSAESPPPGGPERILPPAPEPVVASAAGRDAEPAGAPARSVRVRVVSTPPGADVLLGGKPIGTTPLDTNLERGTGAATLTLHRAKFKDVTQAVDLTSDVSVEVTLAELVAEDPAKPAPSRPARSSQRDRTATREVRRGQAPAAPKCQPPDKYNPFDTSCDGQPCPPCGH